MKRGPQFSCLLLVIIFLAPSVFAAEEAARDVFQPSILPVSEGGPVGEAPATAADLQGISIGAKTSFAVINGLVYHEGEEKQGIKVTQIRKREVDIVMNGVPGILRMVPERRHKSVEESESPGVSESQDVSV